MYGILNISSNGVSQYKDPNYKKPVIILFPALSFLLLGAERFIIFCIFLVVSG